MSSIVSAYNDRLFSGGIRSRIHFARFYWLQNTIQRMNLPTKKVIEIGCFDGKSIEYLPSLPQRYVGLDANWENGLDIARQNYPHYQFIEGTDPSDLDQVKGTYNLGISQETMEHIDPNMIPDYLEQLSNIIDGYMLITVPNEIGLLFFAKQLTKKLFCQDDDTTYSIREFIHQTLGNTQNVERGIGSHKGFNQKELIQTISEFFEIVDVQGIPFTSLPTFLGFNVGIICKSKS